MQQKVQTWNHIIRLMSLTPHSLLLEDVPNGSVVQKRDQTCRPKLGPCQAQHGKTWLQVFHEVIIDLEPRH